MNEQDPDVAAIVKKLKEKAQESPWVPVGVPSREHFHTLPNGLSICFTLDILPKGRYWHLSIARMIHGDLTEEEVKFWRWAFFKEEPTTELPGQILPSSSRHFHWRVS